MSTEMRVPVTVRWRNQEPGVWTAFTLVGIYGDLVRLEGRDDPDGTAHDGTVIWVHSSEISEMWEEAGE